MQIYNNRHEIYKNVGVMHAVVFADGAREAKNAQVVGDNQNFEGLKKRKNRNRNGERSNKGKQNDNTCSFWGRLGGKKVTFLIEIAWSSFAKLCSPPKQEA